MYTFNYIVVTYCSMAFEFPVFVWLKIPLNPFQGYLVCSAVSHTCTGVQVTGGFSILLQSTTCQQCSHLYTINPFMAYPLSLILPLSLRALSPTYHSILLSFAQLSVITQQCVMQLLHAWGGAQRLIIQLMSYESDIVQDLNAPHQSLGDSSPHLIPLLIKEKTPNLSINPLIAAQ